MTATLPAQPKGNAMPTEREALRVAIDALEEIALAGMSGSGQESEEGMRDWHARRAWEFIRIAARALEEIKPAAQAAPVPSADAADAQFEALCREHGIAGTAAAAQCRVFWDAARAAQQGAKHG